MRIFLTGASGVVGRRLVPILRNAGHDVTAVVRSVAASGVLERQGATVVNVDLFDRKTVRAAVAGHDAVVNLATHMPQSTALMFIPWAWHQNDKLRSVASNMLVDACLAAHVPRFVQESFAPAYPHSGTRWIDETTPLSPVRYNASLLDAEGAAERFSRSGGAGVVLRFGAFYGIDAQQTSDLIEWVQRGRAPLPGPPNAFISSVSHDDAARATAAAVGLPGGIYNVVDDEPVTHRVFVDSLAAGLAVDPPTLPPTWLTPLFGPLGRLVARSVRVSNRKLRLACGWTPKYPSVREGWEAILDMLELDSDFGAHERHA
jgi:nucleoside-diphosphate-sugar epimerase